MDLLEKLNLILPEQQTRISTEVSIALESNSDIRLGFDACCNCAKPLNDNNSATINSDKSEITCKGCQRVWYCSKKCREEDSHVPINEDEHALGHSSVVCMLLRLCQIDDETEEPSYSSSSSNNSNKLTFKISQEEREASLFRILQEHESYPATLANVIMDAPCFQPVLEKFKKSNRHHHSHKTQEINKSQKVEHTKKHHGHHHHHTLTIHIVGASEECELWGNFDAKKYSSCNDVYDAYVEALTELTVSFQDIKTIRIIFVGPQCPEINRRVVRSVTPGKVMGNNNNDYDTSSTPSTKHSTKRKRETENHEDTVKVIIETHRCNYDSQFLKNGSQISEDDHIGDDKPRKPDIIVFFNPGFTCPDYSWGEALDVCKNYSNSTRVPFLVATNTEMEAMADLQYLHQNGYIESLPSIVDDIVNEGVENEHDVESVEYSSNNIMFFGENPNAGSRVRQSGNMANDLYVKNRWIFGGIFSLANDTKKSPNKSNSGDHTVDIDSNDDDQKQQTSNKKRKESKIGMGNTKKKNPALI